jgi:hypothetical protein
MGYIFQSLERKKKDIKAENNHKLFHRSVSSAEDTNNAAVHLSYLIFYEIVQEGFRMRTLTVTV